MHAQVTYIAYLHVYAYAHACASHPPHACLQLLMFLLLRLVSKSFDFPRQCRAFHPSECSGCVAL